MSLGKETTRAQVIENLMTEAAIKDKKKLTEASAPETRSQRLFERAKKVMPGGVNSPARACRAVDSDPVFIARADGPYLIDIDDTEYLDYVLSWGPMILGHRHPRLLEAFETALSHGTSYGAPCKDEVELAELVSELLPSMEMVRMVNSGTEACMSAIRLARAFTRRDMIIKFDGCYHGHADGFLVKAGSGLATHGISSSPGVPEEITKLTVSIPFNDLDAVTKAFQENKDEIAAVIIEPIVGNAGLINPNEGYLEGLRELCTKHKALLIFDEVMTGFRVAKGGAQRLFNVTPDLTCLGKIIGGGMPVGAYGGRRDIMEMVAPQGSVYQAGTLSGNPLAMAAGLAQLKVLRSEKIYGELKENTEKLVDGIKNAIKEHGVNATVSHTCGMLTVFFAKNEVTNFEEAQKADTEMFAKVWKELLNQGVYWPPSQFEAAFLSTMHTKRIIEQTIEAFDKAFKAVS